VSSDFTTAPLSSTLRQRLSFIPAIHALPIRVEVVKSEERAGIGDLAFTLTVGTVKWLISGVVMDLNSGTAEEEDETMSRGMLVEAWTA
jgi:hypothetical protein